MSSPTKISRANHRRCPSPLNGGLEFGRVDQWIAPISFRALDVFPGYILSAVARPMVTVFLESRPFFVRRKPQHHERARHQSCLREPQEQPPSQLAAVLHRGGNAGSLFFECNGKIWDVRVQLQGDTVLCTVRGISVSGVGR